MCICGLDVSFKWLSKLAFASVVTVSLIGCGGQKPEELSNSSLLDTNKIEIDQVNEKLNLASSRKDRTSIGYNIHVGDILKVDVFQVEELSQSYQVGSRGRIFVPLLGQLRVKGLSVDEVQSLLSANLSKNLLKNPQVNVSILEYAPQQVTVMGAVSRPDIYDITQGRNIYEMLTLAGGFADDAGSSVYIKSAQTNKESGQIETITLSVDVHDMFEVETVKALETQQTLKQLMLGNGDSIFVSKAGAVYVDGPIKKPGKYILEGETTVTQILAIAGGGDFVSSERDVNVLRRENGEVKIYKVNVSKVRAGKEKDLLLKGGDIVTIGKSALKSATKGFFDYFLRLVFLF